MPTTSPKKHVHKHAQRLNRGPHGGIELLLVQSVDHLGKQGDVVEVKRGYAMNYLLPQGLATVANDHHKRMVEKHRARLQAIQNDRLAGLRKLGDDLGRQSITIEANANDEGHLYGSVGAPEISKMLYGKNLRVEPEMVKLHGPIKECALYEVDLTLGYDIETKVAVVVVPLIQAEKK